MTSIISPDDTQRDTDQPADGRAGAITAPLGPIERQKPAEAGKPSQRPVEPWLRLAALVALGGISGVAYYLGFVRPYLLTTYYTKPLQDLAKINGHSAPSANEWAFTWLVLFACYYLAFRLCPPGEGTTRFYRRAALFLICGWAAFFAINLIFMYPVGAADLFDQIFRARLTAHYGFNPFTTLPSSFPGDPFQAYVAWRGDPSPYGPMWEALAAGASYLGGDSLWNNLIIFKALVVLAYGVSVGLTYRILRAWKPDWALRGTLFYAWNPLVLFEVAGNGHNDAVVVMFMLLGIYVLVLARRWAILPALVAGALTKFVPILLVPVAIAAIWRDRLRLARSERKGLRTEQTANSVLGPLSSVLVLDTWRSLAVGAVLSVGLGLVLYAPFWTGLDGILPRNRGNLFTASIPKVIVDALVRFGSTDETTAESLVKNTAYALVGLIAIGLALYVFRSRNAVTPEGREKLVGTTLVAFYEIIFAYLAIAALWFQPWYLMWLVALTAPVARPSYVNRTLLFCIGGVANYFVWDYIWLWNRTDIRTLQITSALAIYTLPLLYTFYVWLRPRFSKL
jgi:alpha-1,6-mannosyltransferase